MERPVADTYCQNGKGLRLNLNESPRELPDELKREVLERLACLTWRRYPDLEMKGCRRIIAAWYGLEEDWVVLGNGSNELLMTSLLAFSSSGGRIAWISPGFSMVPRMAGWLDRLLMQLTLSKEDFCFFDFSMSTALHRAEMVLMASPNNPSGTSFSRPLLHELMSVYCRPVVIDEAYAEFTRDTFVADLDRYSNLVVLRTFSKAFSLAGGRIGYALAQPALVKRLESCRSPFSVGLFQQACIEALDRSKGFVENVVADICRQRDILSEGLRSRKDFTVIDSQANFILFSPGPGKGENLYQWLQRNGIWVRSFSEPGMKDWLRVTVGYEEENRIFLEMALSWTGV